ncbi:hypothetical protein B8W90_13730, partial [Staphylococcus hominis]
GVCQCGWREEVRQRLRGCLGAGDGAGPVRPAPVTRVWGRTTNGRALPVTSRPRITSRQDRPGP